MTPEGTFMSYACRLRLLHPCVRQVLLFCVVVGLFYATGSQTYAQEPLSCGQRIHPARGVAFAPTVTPGANLVSIGDVVYFISRDETGGGTDPRYLWRTDGTPTGTFTLTAPVDEFTPLYLMASIDDKLVFRASVPATGAELWISDGTPQGTQLLKDVTPGPAATTYQSTWFELQQRLFFGVYEEGEISWWVTDGTMTNTVPLEALYSGEQPANLQWLTQSTTEAYLVSYAAGQTMTLWRFAEAGFQPVKVFTGSTDSAEQAIMGQALVQNGKLYFFAKIAGGGSGLWRSDGTAAGTTLLFPSDFVLPTASTVVSGVHPYTLLATADGTLYFFEYDQPLVRLWRLDSQTDTVTLVKTIRLRSEDDVYYDAHYEAALIYDEYLYFSLWWRDNRLDLSQMEIWRSDGTATGTQLFTTLPNSSLLNFGTPRGLFLTTNSGVAGTYISFAAWQYPRATVVCNLGSHFIAYPQPFLHNNTIYVSGRDAWLGKEYLWRLDPDLLQPTTIFFPNIAR